MSELSTADPVEAVAKTEHTLEYLSESFGNAISNLEALKSILDGSKNPEGNIYIETRSHCLDIGGFFMDEPNSDPRYRSRMFVGGGGGDALAGIDARLVSRVQGKKSVLQLEVNFSDRSDPIVGYFDLEEILHGCLIQ